MPIELEHAVLHDAQARAEQSLLDAAIKESQEDAMRADAPLAAAIAASLGAPTVAPDVSDGAGHVGGGGGGGAPNAVRELERGFARTEGLPNVATAAAARSRSGTVSSDVSTLGELPYRSDSMKRVYEAQHHFVLAQLTAPGVEAFLADDFSDDEFEEADEGRLSRSASKFV